MKKTALTFFTVCLLSAVFLMELSFNVQPVKANGTIYIKADGSIDPPTANITSIDDVTYTFTDNNHDEIVVERDNIVIDGAGYTVQGTVATVCPNCGTPIPSFRAVCPGCGSIVAIGKGIALSFRSNVTIKNTIIRNFLWGVSLNSTSQSVISGNNITDNFGGVLLGYSSNNTIHGSSIANNSYGINLELGSSDNVIQGSNITDNGKGVAIVNSSNNTISGNNILNNTEVGIHLWEGSRGSIVSENNIINNGYGVRIDLYSWDNVLYHNNFINNTHQVAPYSMETHTWDDGYPSGGNYWSDYEEKYPFAEELDGSGIWDTPYVINENNQDNYPIVPEFPSFLVLPLLMIPTLLIVIFYRRKHSM